MSVKMMIGLVAVAIGSVATTISASAQQKQITATIPKQVCEMVTADAQNWRKKKIHLCGLAPRMDLAAEPPQNSNRIGTDDALKFRLSGRICRALRHVVTSTFRAALALAYQEFP
jgi:hypothetical protein